MAGCGSPPNQSGPVHPRHSLSPATFEVTSSTSGESAVELKVRGELDLASAPELVRALVRAEREKPGIITLELSGLDFMDATGLRAILEAIRRARHDGRRLTVRNPTQPVLRLFQLAGIDLP